MKFITIDKSAATTLVSMRTLQSTEYDNGRFLVDIITNGVDEDCLIGSVGIAKVRDGVCFVGGSGGLESQVIVDLENFSGFENSSRQDVLSIFQKVCRVSLKYWDKIPFGSREWFKSEMDLVVFIPKKNRESLNNSLF